jgi:hypothetical protein
MSEQPGVTARRRRRWWDELWALGVIGLVFVGPFVVFDDPDLAGAVVFLLFGQLVTWPKKSPMHLRRER